MKGVCVGLVLGLAISVVHAEDYDGIPDKFFAKVAAHRYQESFKAMKFPEEADLDVPRMKKFLSSVFYGRYKSHTLTSEKRIGTRYSTLTYLVDMGKYQAGMSINLYRPESHWMTIGFNMNTNYKSLTDEPDSAK